MSSPLKSLRSPRTHPSFVTSNIVGRPPATHCRLPSIFFFFDLVLDKVNMGRLQEAASIHLKSLGFDRPTDF